MLCVPEGVQCKAVLDGSGGRGGQGLLSAQRKWLNTVNVNQNENKENIEKCVVEVVIVIHERTTE